MKPSLIVMSAVSGAGKTTLQQHIMPLYPKLRYSISVTTREPRTGEEDGIHYFFRTREQFEELIANNELVEYMEVHGNYYGTPKFFIEDSLKAGYSVLFDMDVYGKTKFDESYPEAKGIFVTPPDFEELEKRLRSRGTDSDEVINLRLKNARDEMEYAKSKGKYEYWLVNDQLEVAQKKLVEIIEEIGEIK